MGMIVKYVCYRRRLGGESALNEVNVMMTCTPVTECRREISSDS